ncbi:MAG: hypothetical protein ACRDBQ_02425 [Shewanella sp.]
MSSYKVFDSSELDKLARDYGLSSEVAKHSLSDTINHFANITLDESVKRIAKELNLTDAYIRGKIAVSTRSKPNTLEAIVSANVRPLLLSRFDPIQHFKTGKTKGAVPNGVSIQVKANGGRTHMQSAFMIPLKRGRESGAGAKGLAVRPPPGMRLSPSAQREVNKRGFAILHGPSPDQVFRTFLPELAPSAEEMMLYLLAKLEQESNG